MHGSSTLYAATATSALTSQSKSEATDYELNVWYDDYSSSVPEKDILDVTFSSKPDSWTYEGYTAVESGKLRLGSGKDDGSAISPVVDLSADDVSITVEASPYRTTDNSVLYILVDLSLIHI